MRRIPRSVGAPRRNSATDAVTATPAAPTIATHTDAGRRAVVRSVTVIAPPTPRDGGDSSARRPTLAAAARGQATTNSSAATDLRTAGGLDVEASVASDGHVGTAG